jgi:AcrR family transcriptional regulator
MAVRLAEVALEPRGTHFLLWMWRDVGRRLLFGSEAQFGCIGRGDRHSDCRMAERKVLKRRLSKEQRHAQLLSCAIHVAAEKGLGQTVHADVANQAGVGTANVFRYFPTRRDLIRGIVQEIGRYYIEQSDLCHASAGLPLEILQRHLKAFSQSVDDHPDYAAVWLQWSASVQNDCGIWDMLQDHNDRLIETISRTIRKTPSQEPHDVALSRIRARALLGNAFTLTVWKFSSAPKAETEQFISIVHGEHLLG